MADIELVIKIPEEEYKNYLNMRPAYPKGVFCYIKAIQNGTPLPKGHGDLIDRKLALNDNFRGLCEFQIYDDYVKMKNYLKSLPIIIKAESEEKNDKVAE